MSKPIDLPWPKLGLSDAQAFADQEAGTTREASNVRTVDPKTGRERGAQRSGQSLYVTGQANGANKIKRIASVAYDNKNLTYSLLGAGLEENAWGVPNPTNVDSPGISSDRQSNVYVLDGPSGVAKYNSENALQWKLSLPVVHPRHVVRALLVDEFDGIYAGVSTGGDSLLGRLWKYRQLEDKKTEQQWEVKTLGYVERIQRKDSLLYTIQNFPESGQAYLVVYQDIDSASPSEAWRKGIPYPANDLAVGPKDGSLFVASEPNTTRGFDPRSKHTTAKSVDWTPENLPNWKKRGWAWLDATDRDSLTILPKSGSEEDEGGEVLVWFDKTGKGRNLYADAFSLTDPGAVASAVSPAPDKGPSYRKVGIGGLPSLKFNGKTTAASTTTIAGVTGNSMYSSAPSSIDRAYRDDQLSLLPTYSAAQFVCCMVVQFPIEDQARYILSFNTANRALLVNREQALDPFTAPGLVRLFEIAGTSSTAGSSSPAAGIPPGQYSHPMPMSAGPYGHAVITWICDGGVHDVFGTATRSTLRVNGRAADRWQSAAFTTLQPTMLGYGGIVSGLGADVIRFAGSVGEIVVLSDWEDDDEVRQRLISYDGQPDNGGSFTAPTVSSELEQLEGYLAHKWGIAHLLPGGRAGVWYATGNPNNNDTVTIAGITYTWKTSPSATVANEIAINADFVKTVQNLAYAINRTGVPGSNPTQANPHVYATYATPSSLVGSAFWMTVVARASQGGLTASLAESTANAEWKGSSPFGVTSHIAYPLTENYGWVPHAHHIEKVQTVCMGGPPSSDTLGTRSKLGDLNSKNGILTKFDPANGNPKWILTSGYQLSGFTLGSGEHGVGVGGVGYGVALNSAGEIYSFGPKQISSWALTAPGGWAQQEGPPITGDLTEFRKVVDGGTSPTLTGGATDLATPWAVTLSPAIIGATWTAATRTLTKVGAFLNYTFGAGDYFYWSNVPLFPEIQGWALIESRTSDDAIVLVQSISATDIVGTVNGWLFGSLYHYPRMAVDKFDSVYLPGHNTASDTKTMLVYQRASTVAATTTPVLLVSLSNLTDDPQAHAIALDPNVPEYETDLSSTSNPIQARAKYAYIGTRVETATNKTTVYKIRLVAEAPFAGPPRAETYLVVSGQKLKTFTDLAFGAEVGTDIFASGAQFIDWVALYQKVYFTDGRSYHVFDPKLGTVAVHKCTSAGEIPKNCKLLSAYRGRLTAARDPNDPHNWHMAKQGDPANWDRFPPVIVATQAVSGNDSRMGVCPDIVNALCPYSDDILIFGGEHTIQQMTGDPMAGGQFDLVTDVTGMSFGPSWTKDPQGALFFHGTTGKVYGMSPGSRPEPISDRIERRLRDVNFATHYVDVKWDSRAGGLFVIPMPYGAGGTHVKRYFFEARVGGWHEDEVGTSTLTAVQATAAHVLDGDTLANRILLIGTEDGQIMKVDEDAKSDGSTFSGSPVRIDGNTLLGPFTPGDGNSEYVFSHLRGVLANDQDGCNFEWYASDTPDVTGARKISGTFEPGHNAYEHDRIRGVYVWLRLRNAALNQRFALEALSCQAREAGRVHA